MAAIRILLAARLVGRGVRLAPDFDAVERLGWGAMIYFAVIFAAMKLLGRLPLFMAFGVALVATAIMFGAWGAAVLMMGR